MRQVCGKWALSGNSVLLFSLQCEPLERGACLAVTGPSLLGSVAPHCDMSHTWVGVWAICKQTCERVPHSSVNCLREPIHGAGDGGRAPGQSAHLRSQASDPQGPCRSISLHSVLWSFLCLFLRLTTTAARPALSPVLLAPARRLGSRDLTCGDSSMEDFAISQDTPWNLCSAFSCALVPFCSVLF